MNTVKIDDKEYAIDSLSNEAKTDIAGIQAVDRRTQDLREQLTLMQVARATYVKDLKIKLEGVPSLEINRVKDDEQSRTEINSETSEETDTIQ